MTHRDSKGRFAKEPEPEFNWTAVFWIAVCITARLVITFAPQWFNDIKTSAWNAGNQSGCGLGYSTGTVNGVKMVNIKNAMDLQRLIDTEGYKQNPYSSGLYCNDTFCKSYDSNYNLEMSFRTESAIWNLDYYCYTDTDSWSPCK